MSKNNFCFSCGAPVGKPDSARFCSSCGTSLVNSNPAAAQGALSVASVLPSPVSPILSSSVLFNHAGLPQPAFERLASQIFDALDQGFAPQRAGGLDATKMLTFINLAGIPPPPYYAEWVLPTFASVIGMELVPNRPRNASIVTRNGWRQYLQQKIKFDPDAAYLQITNVLSALGITITFTRADFPSMPSPDAQAKQEHFRALARQAMTMGATSRSWGHMGLGRSGFGVRPSFGSATAAPGRAESAVRTANSTVQLANNTMGFLNALGGGGC